MVLTPYRQNPLSMSYVLLGAVLERAIKAKAFPPDLKFFENRSPDFWTR